MSRFWTRAVTGVRFPACTCSTQPQINLKSLVGVAVCHIEDCASAWEGGKKQETHPEGDVVTCEVPNGNVLPQWRSDCSEPL